MTTAHKLNVNQNDVSVDFPNDDIIYKTACELVEKFEKIVDEAVTKLSNKSPNNKRDILLHKLRQKTVDALLTQEEYTDVFHDILTDFRAGEFDDELLVVQRWSINDVIEIATEHQIFFDCGNAQTILDHFLECCSMVDTDVSYEKMVVAIKEHAARYLKHLKNPIQEDVDHLHDGLTHAPLARSTGIFQCIHCHICFNHDTLKILNEDYKGQCSRCYSKDSVVEVA